MTKDKRFPLLRGTAAACLVAATLSLFTPYPAQIIRALKGGDVGHETPADAPPRLPAEASPAPPPPPVVVPTPPADREADANFVDVRTITPWSVEQAFTMPPVKYPPFPPVLPTRPADNAVWNISELARGLNLKTGVQFKPGGLASADRKILSNYRATLSLDITVPQALTKTGELAKLNPHLGKMLPGLEDLFKGAKISPWYGNIYSLKQNEVRRNLASLNKVLDRHNFYDTETILEMKHPASGRKVLWLQSEMDVVSDGSDGDRLASMPDSILKSSYYQPSTSYRWRKKTDKANPLLAVWEKRLKEAKTSLSSAKPADKQAINNRIDHAQRVITELKTYSFLIAEYDPFIVMPLGVVNQGTDFSPAFGDYVVVVVGDKLYPAIVGDAGPRYKTGEASLRLAQTVNPKASSYSRPVSDLVVSYIIFPGTAHETKGPPNYDEWKKRCVELMNDIGGIGANYSLHDWKDLLAPEPAPPAEPARPPADEPKDNPPATAP